MQKHDDGSVTFTKQEFALIGESWAEVTGILCDMPCSIGDFLTTRGGDDTALWRYRKADTLMMGADWPGIRQYLNEEYGLEYAQESRFDRFFDEDLSDAEADALLDPREY